MHLTDLGDEPLRVLKVLKAHPSYGHLAGASLLKLKHQLPLPLLDDSVSVALKDEARPSDAQEIASVLQEAAQWLCDGGRALWSGAEIGHERVLRDTSAGLFYVARADAQLAGVMKFELEDPIFWPEIAPGTNHVPFLLDRSRQRVSSTSCCAPWWASRVRSSAWSASSRRATFAVSGGHLPVLQLSA